MNTKYAIIDWDDTLYDTYGLRKATDQVFADHGINPVLAQQLLKEKMAREKIPSQDYSPELHLQALQEAEIVHSHHLARVSDTYQELIKDMGKFFPSSSLDFLKRLRSELHLEPVILTYGQNELQSSKIKHSGVLESMAGLQVYIIQTNKKEFIEQQLLPELGGRENVVYFINDKITETQEIHEQLKIPCILKMPSYLANEAPRDHHCQYNEGDYERSGLPHFNNFIDIFRYIEQRERQEFLEMRRK